MKKYRELLLFEEAGNFHITDFPDRIATIAEYACHYRRIFAEPLGSFSKDDGGDNENVKKNNRLIKQNNKFARASRFFVHFSAAYARLQHESA